MYSLWYKYNLRLCFLPGRGFSVVVERLLSNPEVLGLRPGWGNISLVNFIYGISQYRNWKYDINKSLNYHSMKSSKQKEGHRKYGLKPEGSPPGGDPKYTPQNCKWLAPKTIQLKGHWKCPLVVIFFHQERELREKTFWRQVALATMPTGTLFSICSFSECGLW